VLGIDRLCRSITQAVKKRNIRSYQRLYPLSSAMEKALKALFSSPIVHHPSAAVVLTK
jgi:hypothetical protein